MKSKLLKIYSCKECLNIKYNKYTKPKAYCAEMSPDREINVDFSKHIPTWCPFPDAPLEGE